MEVLITPWVSMSARKAVMSSARRALLVARHLQGRGVAAWWRSAALAHAAGTLQRRGQAALLLQRRRLLLLGRRKSRLLLR